MNKPLITVSVSAYNHEQYIKEAIESIVMQTYGYDNIQLIVIDDNSQDRTPEILEKLSIKYNFLFIKNESNKGICRNKNKILKLSKGKYITGCASDDMWLPNKLKVQVKYMEENSDIVASSGGYFIIDNDTNIIDEREFSYLEFNFKDVFVYGKRLPAAGSILRREKLLEIGGYNEDLKIEDATMWLKLTEAGYKISILPEKLFKYRKHNNNLTKNNKIMREEQLKYLNLYKEHDLYEVAINNYYTRQFYFFCKRDKKIAIESFKKINDKKFNFNTFKSLVFMLIPQSILDKYYL